MIRKTRQIKSVKETVLASLIFARRPIAVHPRVVGSWERGLQAASA